MSHANYRIGFAIGLPSFRRSKFLMFWLPDSSGVLTVDSA